MKKLFAIVLTLLSAVALNAQIVKVSFGAKGVGLATLPRTEISPTTKVQLGGGGGLFVGMKITDWFGVQVEGLYGVQTASYPHSVSSISGSSSTFKTNSGYLYIPVVAQLWLGRSFAFEAGWQQAIVMSGKIISDGKTSVDNGVLDYGSFIAGININAGKVVFFNIRYSLALNYSYVMTSEPSKNMGLQLGIGFRFYTSRKSIFD
ncbi:MAG: outer membrane beta-barrel protein [Candidatus Cryptobacteroides sp.]